MGLAVEFVTIRACLTPSTYSNPFQVILNIFHVSWSLAFIRTTCPSHLSLAIFTDFTISGSWYILYSSKLYLDAASSFLVNVQVSEPYISTGLISVL